MQRRGKGPRPRDGPQDGDDDKGQFPLKSRAPQGRIRDRRV